MGVVAFSVAQQEAIQDELARRLRIEPALEGYLGEGRLNGFFIKNLETVQGDERDVSFFSIGYGRDEDGRLYHNFGPLNRPGGARRLNVAITRARRKVIVVSSIRADELKLSPQRSDGLPNGAWLLRAYLEYAERGSIIESTSAYRPDGESSTLERDVAAFVQGAGYEVVMRVGTSRYRVDIGVVSKVEPGRICLGIECDGDMYRSALTARDRDRLRASVLTKLGWRIHRIWAQDWLSRRTSATETLRAAIIEAEAAVKRGGGAPSQETSDKSPATPSPPTAARHRSEDAEAAAVGANADSPDGAALRGLPSTTPYRCAEVASYDEAQRVRLEFHDSSIRGAHEARITSLIRAEGPMHERYVAMRLSRAFGSARTGNRMSEAIDSALENLQRARQISRRGPFLWPPDFQLTHVRVPVDSDADSIRPIVTSHPRSWISRSLGLLTQLPRLTSHLSGSMSQDSSGSTAPVSGSARSSTSALLAS